jgi:Asparagine synthase/Chain length determinant protein
LKRAVRCSIIAWSNSLGGCRCAKKIHGGGGKRPLRRLLRRYAPEQVAARAKHGFNVPVGEWLRGPLRPWAEDTLSESRLRQHGLLDVAHVQNCLARHISGAQDHAYALWAILMVQSWLDASQKQIRNARPGGRMHGSVCACIGRATWSRSTTLTDPSPFSQELSTLLRRRWTILLTATLGAAVVFGVATMLPLRYTAKAQLVVKSQQPSVLADQQAVITQPEP